MDAANRSNDRPIPPGLVDDDGPADALLREVADTLELLVHVFEFGGEVQATEALSNTVERARMKILTARQLYRDGSG